MLRSIKLSLRTRELDCYDYSKSTNPPILHRKETLLPPGHALVAKFIPTAYVESVGIGDALPSLSIFLSETRYILAPLEATYQEAWAVFPTMLKERHRADGAVSEIL